MITGKNFHNDVSKSFLSLYTFNLPQLSLLIYVLSQTEYRDVSLTSMSSNVLTLRPPTTISVSAGH